MISRESANAAFRDCLPPPDQRTPSQDHTTTVSCLLEVTNSLNNELATQFPEFTARGGLAVSVYAKDPANNNNNTNVFLLARQISPQNGFQSRVTASNINKPLVQAYGAVVIGESFFTYQPISPLQNMFNFLGLNSVIPTVIYEATIS